MFLDTSSKHYRVLMPHCKNIKNHQLVGDGELLLTMKIIMQRSQIILIIILVNLLIDAKVIVEHPINIKEPLTISSMMIIIIIFVMLDHYQS